MNNLDADIIIVGAGTHGGLRYLESLELNLAYECLSDRHRLLKHYPDLIKLQR